MDELLFYQYVSETLILKAINISEKYGLSLEKTGSMMANELKKQNLDNGDFSHIIPVLKAYSGTEYKNKARDIIIKNLEAISA